MAKRSQQEEQQHRKQQEQSDRSNRGMKSRISTQGAPQSSTGKPDHERHVPTTRAIHKEVHDAALGLVEFAQQVQDEALIRTWYRSRKLYASLKPLSPVIRAVNTLPRRKIVKHARYRN